eukprot:jgi/Mesvir1/15919/Mv08243-RA.1
MSFLSKSKLKKPHELTKLTREALAHLDASNKGFEKSVEECTKYLHSMKVILYGDPETEPNDELCIQLAAEICSTDTIDWLVKNLSFLEFEAKKDAALVFNNLLRRHVEGRPVVVDYLQSRPQLLAILVQGYTSTEIALNCGTMLRECIRHEPLARLILHSPAFVGFFSYVETSAFDVASDAFATFKELLTKHKHLVAEYLTSKYDEFFEAYTKLLTSENYVTRRQSLKLLGEILLDRANVNAMMRYISDATNLRLMMNLLTDSSKSIQYEAFHVFKVRRQAACVGILMAAGHTAGMVVDGYRAKVDEAQTRSIVVCSQGHQLVGHMAFDGTPGI